MLKIDGLSFSFGKKVVLDKLSLHLDSGKYALLGPNGAGKTTLMRCISGIYQPQAGQIHLGADDESTRSIALGYLPQNFDSFHNLSVSEALDLVGYFKGLPGLELTSAVDEVLAAVHLVDQKQTRVSKLSGGMLRRLGIAQAMLGDQQILLLDEPMVGLDPEERLSFKQILKRISADKLLLISTHVVDDIRYVCDKIIILTTAGIQFSGTQATLLASMQGKVYAVPERELDVALPCAVLSRSEDSEEGIVRVYSEAGVDFESVEPTLEDAYIAYVNGYLNA